MRSVISIAMAALIVSMALSAIAVQTSKAQPRPTQLPANIGNMTNPTEPSGNHLPVKTVQDDRLIVTTVTKSGEPPTGPIVIIPPQPDKPGNGTIITPGENVTAPGGGGNVTGPTENVTAPIGGNEGQGGNVTVISPGGNVTEIPGNITAIGNDTIIITEPGRNITETPGNVTVIDPPVGQTEQPATPGNNCSCNQPAQIPPVTITPAPGQNVTTLPHPSENATTQPLPPTNPPAAENNQTGNTSGLKPTHPIVMPPTSNETQNNPPPANNETTPPANNSTGNNNNTNSTEPPHATQLPAATILPEFHINSVSYKYNGVNTQWLNK